MAWVPLIIPRPISFPGRAGGWIHPMFSDMQFETFPSRAAAASTLKSRCSNNTATTKKDAWNKAWTNFCIDGFDQIPPFKAISLYDSKGDQKREAYESRYKLLAVQNFLPILKSRLPLLSGKAQIRVQNSILLLDLWRKQMLLPERVFPTRPKPSRKNATPLPPLCQLPLPPRFKTIHIPPQPTQPKKRAGTKPARRQKLNNDKTGEEERAELAHGFRSPAILADPDLPAEFHFEYEPLRDHEYQGLHSQKLPYLPPN